jgi:hypothetical protein
MYRCFHCAPREISVVFALTLVINACSSDETTGGAGGGAQTATSSGHASSSSSEMPCPDAGPDEANNSEVAAHDLGSITDCDETGGTVQGLIHGPSDIDWYRYKGSDTPSCVVDPASTLLASKPLRLCVYFDCISGTSLVPCSSPTTTATSPDGRSGCCGQSAVSLFPTCVTGDDSAFVYMSIDDPSGDTCVNYTLSYHF